MSSYTTVSAEKGEDMRIHWGGTNRDIPILTIADTPIFLDRLGADLGPWLLALSDQLAEFAATVTPEGTPKLRVRGLSPVRLNPEPVETLAEVPC